MSKIDLITKRLENVWENIADFIKVQNDSLLYIIDIEGQSYLQVDCSDEDKCFKIINSTELPVCQIPIDGKEGLFGFGTSHCDTVIFNNKSFCFIEFKYNATSIEIRAISKNRKKAISQLSNTINEFDNQLSKNYEGLDLEAIVSTPKTYPRKDTAWDSLAVEFLEEYGIPLTECNEKDFG